MEFPSICLRLSGILGSDRSSQLGQAKPGQVKFDQVSQSQREASRSSQFGQAKSGQVKVGQVSQSQREATSQFCPNTATARL